MSNVVVVDNGGGIIKAGQGGDRDPAALIPNCQYRPLFSKKYLSPTPVTISSEDLTSAAVRRPIDRGYLINPDLQRDIWNYLFSALLHVTPSDSSLLLTEPLFCLPQIQRITDELIFEDFGFQSLFVADSPLLAHLYEASRRPYGLLSETRCSLMVDCGFSFTHAAPIFQNVTLCHGVKRIDLGGKVLTNYLKELVSYRSLNVMSESFSMDHVKEKLCFVSLDVTRDLQLARRHGKDNPIRCTYVLPDGITHTRGFVKSLDEVGKYLFLDKGGADPSFDEKKYDETEKLGDRKRIDLAKNEIDLTNERFMVPEMIFQPSDLGLNQAGLAECIVRAVNSCHPLFHPILYESIVLTGGSTLFPQFADRLEMELRPLVPYNYKVKITRQQDPILGVWRGGSILASSSDFESMCITKDEYEECGSDQCRQRFFHEY